MKPTKEQFEDYVAIRDSGVIRDFGMTNMFAINIVSQLSTTGLTREHCIYIMKHFKELMKEYGS